MKKGNLLCGILYLLGGVIFLCVALATDSVLDSLLMGFAGAGLWPGIIMLCKYFYWNAPENRERYQEKLANEEIELHDELKTKLRDRSGRYAYLAGLVTVSVSIPLFSILGKLGVVEEVRCIVLYLAGYLIFQVVIGVVIFRRLLKKYE